MADSVVIVGMACRYPDADDPAQLWDNVLSRRRSFRPLPAQRLPLADYGGEGVDEVYVTSAAVLDGWTFDRQRFRVSGETYRAVDLSHWLALDVSAAALADAGLPDGEGVDRSRVGVVLGNSLTGEFSRAALLRTRWPYVRRALWAALADSPVPPAQWGDLLASVESQYKAPFPAPSDESLAGALANTIAGRVCNYFDFRGTGYTVDGACASSLLAVGTAVTAIASGQLDLALAGGVDLSLDPFELVGFSRVSALAREEMRVYDRHPTGFLPGEGCGVVVLCRESYARQHGLRPYARLLGWGTSSDGNGGLTRPEVAGQRLALARAYASAGVDPSHVELVEGHGTGTEVGDVTEVRALLEVRGTGGQPAVLGSVKANVGHTKAAAGVAGLLKATLALDRQVLPPTTGCVEPHPLLRDGSSLQISDEARPWGGDSRYASVSAMGFGGINTHVVLAGLGASPRRRLSQRERRVAHRHPDVELIVCSAGSGGELAARLRQVHDATGEMSRAELSDLAASLAASERPSAPARFATVARDPSDLAATLARALARLADGDVSSMDHRQGSYLVVGRPLRVGLLFSGQAAPCYRGSGALGDLLASLPDSYRDRLEIADDGAADTSVAQPAIMRASLAGLAWLDALGVRAQQAVGHSLGEITALVWAGALSASDAYQLAVERGRAMAEASPVARAGMVSLAADAACVAELVEDTGAVIAADNTDRQVVVSGLRTQLAEVVERAGRAGIHTTWLPVSHGFHSPLMAPAAAPVRQALERAGWAPARRPVCSTITGRWWRNGDDPVELLVRQLTAPVRFRAARAALAAELLVEVGPGAILANLCGPAAVALDAGSASARPVATVTAALFAAGAVDTVEPYFARRFTRPFPLPRTRQFLTNPCEADPPPLVDVPVPPPDAGPPAALIPAALTPAALTPAALTPGTPVSGGPETAGPDSPNGIEGDPVEVVIARIAALLELDPDSIPPDTRLLADLHLSSPRVTQIVGQVATDLGREQAGAALATVPATVADIAEAVVALPAAGPADRAARGVRPWVRAFEPCLVPEPATTPATPVDVSWEVVGDLAAHPLGDRIRASFPGRSAGTARPARLLVLPPGLAQLPAAEVVAALRASAADQRPLAVLHHGGVGAAVGRSLAAEVPGVPVLVMEVPPDEAGIGWARAESAGGWRGYTEAVYHADGVRRVPVLQPLPVADVGDIDDMDDAASSLRPGEVCLVSGGAKGIGLECALAVGAATGARMVLLGRSPADHDGVRHGLARLVAAGVAAEYHRVDLDDAAAVSRTVAAVRSSYGPVRVLLHSAGYNEPRTIADLTTADLHAALAPKAYGFDRLVVALDPTALRAVITFGSVIGRTGLPGEAAYAIANEWLARRCHELRREHPGVRWLNVEWSAWSGAGMGERLGVLESLSRQGLEPIPVEQGVRWLRRLLAAAQLPTSVLVAGRLPAMDTVTWRAPGGTAAGRFIESTLTDTPGVELVAEAAVSVGTDPYLDDHRIDGTAVLPAVFGLEAMAQVCAALGAATVPGSYRELRFARPVTVPERDHRQLRVAGLRREDGAIEVVARSDETGMSVDHFRAGGCQPIEGGIAAEVDGFRAAGVDAGSAGAGLLPAEPLYGPIFFHGTRFRAVRGFHTVGAYQCRAAVQADGRARWFGSFLDQELQLGDPGARDAFLHVLQVCVPDRRVLPVAVDEVTVYRRPSGRLLLEATQRTEEGDDFIFDVTIRDPDLAMVERWQGLRLHTVKSIALSQWPVPVIGAHLTRTLRRWRLDPAVEFVLTAGAAGQWDLTATVGSAPVASAWQWIPAREVPLATALANDVRERTGEDAATAAARIRACQDVLASPGGAEWEGWRVDEAGAAGWLRLTSDDGELYSAVVESTAGRIAVGVAPKTVD